MSGPYQPQAPPPPQHHYWSPDQIGRIPPPAPPPAPPTPYQPAPSQYAPQQYNTSGQPPQPSLQMKLLQHQYPPPPQQYGSSKSGSSLLKTLNFFSSKPSFQAAITTVAGPGSSSSAAYAASPTVYTPTQPTYPSGLTGPPQSGGYVPQQPQPPQQQQPQQWQPTAPAHNVSTTPQPPQQPTYPPSHSIAQRQHPQIPELAHAQPVEHAPSNPVGPPPPYSQPQQPQQPLVQPLQHKPSLHQAAPPRTPRPMTPPNTNMQMEPVEIHSSPRAPPGPPPQPMLSTISNNSNTSQQHTNQQHTSQQYTAPPPPQEDTPLPPPATNTATNPVQDTVPRTIASLEDPQVQKQSSEPKLEPLPSLPIIPLSLAAPVNTPTATKPPPSPMASYGLKLKIPEAPIAANAEVRARGSADLFWGYLLDESKSPPEPKPILKEFFEQLAKYIISTWEKNQASVISPDSMALFYASLTERGSSRLDFFVSAQTSPKPIIALYQLLGCQYLLIPPRYRPSSTASPTSPSRPRKKLPAQPGLTAAGFAHWMLIHILLDPKREFTRLNRLLQTPGVIIPRKSPEMAPFPELLPRGALPEAPDEEIVRRYAALFKPISPANPEVMRKIAEMEFDGEFGEAGGANGNARADNGSMELQHLRGEVEDLRARLWEREQEIKRLRVQLTQQQQTACAAEAEAAELRRRQSTSSVMSSISVHSHKSHNSVHSQMQAQERQQQQSSFSEPIQMPTPSIPTPSQTPTQPTHMKLMHRQTIHAPTVAGGTAPPVPPLPRHAQSVMGLNAAASASAAGYRPFQPLTPVQSPVIGLGIGTGATRSAGSRRSSTTTSSGHPIPASLCISPVNEHVPAGWGREPTIKVAVGTQEGYRRNDEFARIMGGADV
ncbi:hypothetical protein BDZ91DRAFT_410490 [Kalaharituber pfeilii]|nr:hypothetical protein BDZ91DRAFT_410490 [Kalaharituber pfeilii]